MDDKDKGELIAAFAIGAVVGAGAAFLFRPAPSRADVAHQLLGRARRSGGQWRERAGRARSRAEAAGNSLARASREVLDQFRDEVGEIVGAAREQLAHEVYAQLRGARRTRHEARPAGRRGRR